MSDPVSLRSKADDLAAPLPPLLAQAEHLAANVLLGEHGRRRAGTGDEFWQYRPAHAGDEARFIDWRRSGRSDQHFVREREWQAAQSVMIWVDPARSMEFAGDGSHDSKRTRAQVLALALSVLLVRGGERVGLAGSDIPIGRGKVQVLRMAMALAGDEVAADYAAPDVTGLPSHANAVFISDFLGDPAPVEAAIAAAADRGVKGALLQVLDPVEEAFPFDGRTIFESMSGAVRHETLKAGDLRDRYLDRLAERKARLADLARLSGWHYDCHHTGESPMQALLWLFRAMEGVR